LDLDRSCGYIYHTPKAPVSMLTRFCFFFTPGTLSDLLEARAGTPQPRTDPACLPRDAQHRPQHPYSTGDSNMLDNVSINVNINVNAPAGAGPSPEQPTKHSPTHVPPRPDMPARYRSRLAHRGARREPPPCMQLCSPRCAVCRPCAGLWPGWSSPARRSSRRSSG
jgi:hypothetical protein